MKPVLLIGSILVMQFTVSAQHRLEKLWESDSITLNGPESVLYDPKSNSLFTSNMNAGTVVKYDTKGKLIDSVWAVGFTANKGSAFYKGRYYTSETSAVAVVDSVTRAIISRIPISGAQMLNDLAIDAKGIIYVTDTRAGKVYRIENAKPVLYLENMPGANGLLIENDDLYVLTSSAVLKVKATKEVVKIAEGFEPGLDGIVMVGKNEFVLSNYKGILFYLNSGGTFQTLLDTREIGISANDIGYDNKNQIVYVPSFRTNRIIAYQLK